MKLTTARLKALIREQLEESLNEASGSPNTTRFLEGYSEAMSSTFAGSGQLVKDNQGNLGRAVRFVEHFKAGTKTLGDKHMGRQEFTMPDDSMMVIRQMEIDLIVNQPLQRYGNFLGTLYDKTDNTYSPEVDKMLIYIKIYAKDAEGKQQSGVGRDRQMRDYRVLHMGTELVPVQPSEEMGKKIAAGCIKLEKAISERYEGKTEEKDFVNISDCIKMADAIFAPLGIEFWRYE